MNATPTYHEQKVAGLERKVASIRRRLRGAIVCLGEKDAVPTAIDWFRLNAGPEVVPPAPDSVAEVAINRTVMYAREAAKAGRALEKAEAQLDLAKADLARAQIRTAETLRGTGTPER